MIDGKTMEIVLSSKPCPAPLNKMVWFDITMVDLKCDGGKL